MNTITTDAALDAGAKLLADLIRGLIRSPEGQEDVVLELVAQVSRSPGAGTAEAEVLRRAVERLRGDQRKVCPECRHIFKGNGWDGIDAHWKSKHEAIMPYEDAWPLLKAGRYPGMG